MRQTCVQKFVVPSGLVIEWIQRTNEVTPVDPRYSHPWGIGCEIYFGC